MAPQLTVVLVVLVAATTLARSPGSSLEHLEKQQQASRLLDQQDRAEDMDDLQWMDSSASLPPPSSSPLPPAVSDEDDGGGDSASASASGDISSGEDPSGGVTTNCSSCMLREELRQLNLEVIKEQILNKLGMKEAPNITGRVLPKIPPLHHLLDMYGIQSDAPAKGFQTGVVFEEEEDDFHARSEKVISFAQPYPNMQPLSKELDVQYFKFSERLTQNKVLKALMWLYVLPGLAPHQNQHLQHHQHHHQARLHDDNVIVINIFRVMRAPEGESPLLVQIRSTKVQLKVDRGGWVSLNSTGLVKEWFRRPHDNLGIVIRAEDRHGRKMVVTDPTQGEESHVLMQEGRKYRKKRTIGLNCNENSSETRCCRYPLTVDFEEFGWDWIIAPKKYEANYCSGECPYVFLQKYPHTHIVQQANPSGTAGPCCAPRKMSPISMLYFDNEFNIIFGLLPGMVVDRCGCS